METSGARLTVSPRSCARRAALRRYGPARAYERMRVTVDKTTIDGVRAFIVLPKTIAPENRNRMLIHMHGGCYVLSPGEAALPEAIMMVGFGGFKVISVDYRMPPKAYFPAALDSGMTLYRNTLKATDARNIAIFDMSAGGALTPAMVLRAKQMDLPVPGAMDSAMQAQRSMRLDTT